MLFMKVIKRDGRTVDFDDMNIINALSRANHDVPEDERLSDACIKKIADSIRTLRRHRILAEDIQDRIGQALIDFGKQELCQQYMAYCYAGKVKID